MPQIGGTFVFVTHDQGEAMSLANRVAVMKSGKHPSGRAAGGDLPASALRLRRDFRRRGEHVPRRAAQRDGRTAVGVRSLCRPGTAVVVVVRPEAMTIGPPAGTECFRRRADPGMRLPRLDRRKHVCSRADQRRRPGVSDRCPRRPGAPGVTVAGSVRSNPSFRTDRAESAPTVGLSAGCMLTGVHISAQGRAAGGA